METRELRYFVAVAEELHFGRAAERLQMSQPPLSRAVGLLEQRLGAPLFVRANRSVSLTIAGEVLLEEARRVLAAVDRAERRVRETATGTTEVVLAARTGSKPRFISELLAQYELVAGRPPVRVVLNRSGEQAEMLRDGRADVALLHSPAGDTPGLELEHLWNEGQVALLPAGHPLTSRKTITLVELAEHVDVPVRNWAPPTTASAENDEEAFADLTGLAQMVAPGRAAAVLPSSVAQHLPHQLAAIEVSDARHVTMAIAWPAGRKSDGAREMLAAAHSICEAYHQSKAQERLRVA